GDEDVGAGGGDVDRDLAGGLGRVHDQDRPVGVGQWREVGQVEQVAGEVLDVADADGRGGGVHAVGDLVHVEAARVVQHADQPDLAAGVLGDAVPGVGDAGEVPLRGHHVLAAAGAQPPGHLVQRLGEAGRD